MKVERVDEIIKEDDEPTKEEIIKNIKQGLKEVQLIEQGKMKSRPVRAFLGEKDDISNNEIKELTKEIPPSYKHYSN